MSVIVISDNGNQLHHPAIIITSRPKWCIQCYNAMSVWVLRPQSISSSHTMPLSFSPNLCQKTLEMDVFPLFQGLTCSALWNRKEACCQKMKHLRKLVVALIKAVNSHPMTLSLLNRTWHCSSGQERGGVGIQLPSLSLWPWRDNRQHRAATLSLKKQPVNYPQVSQRRQEASDRR